MVGYISRLTKSILVITLLTFVSGSEVTHGAVGACCLGSTCAVIDVIDCDQQDGHFLAGTFFCQAGICDTGACCTDVVCSANCQNILDFSVRWIGNLDWYWCTTFVVRWGGET